MRKLCLSLSATVLLAFPLAGATAETLIVANRGGGMVTMIDTASNQVIGTVGVSFDPHEVAVSADGKTAYVSNYDGAGGNTISVVDVASRRELRRLDLGSLFGPHGVIERDGRLYFSAESSHAVGRYDLATDSVDWMGHSNQSGSHMLAVTADESKVYSANIGSDSASVIPVTGSMSNPSKQIATVREPEGIALSPNGAQLWVGSRKGFGISIIDTATDSVVATLGGGSAYRIFFTPDSRMVLVPRARSIVVYDPVTRVAVRTVPVSGVVLSIVVAPESTHAWVATTDPAVVQRLDLVTFTLGTPIAVAPTPDGLALSRIVSPQTSGRKRPVKRG